MKSLYAYAFTTALAPVDLFAALRAAGPWSWLDRDSDRWGEYVSTSAGVAGTIVKVFVGEPSPAQCAVNVRFESDDADAAAQDAALRDTLLTGVLPAVGARDVTEIEYLE